VTRLLGVDLGDRRIGLAIADGDRTPARPLATIRRGRDLDADVVALGGVVTREAVTELVVGLPLHAHGDEGAQAASARAWAEAIASALRLPVTMRDERLSSDRAEGRVGPMKRGRSGGPPTASQREAYRSRIDREAAAIILQDELDDRAAGVGRGETLPVPTVDAGERRNDTRNDTSGDTRNDTPSNLPTSDMPTSDMPTRERHA
jgi:putative holliday junction resolvase